jgi:hypothetical protein
MKDLINSNSLPLAHQLGYPSTMPRRTRGGPIKVFKPKGLIEEPFYRKPEPQEGGCNPSVTPDQTPTPGPAVPEQIHIHPTDCCIVDFHLNGHNDDHDGGIVVGVFSREELIATNKGPSALMTTVYQAQDTKTSPDLRWIHVPWNSMQDTEVRSRDSSLYFLQLPTFDF